MKNALARIASPLLAALAEINLSGQALETLGMATQCEISVRVEASGAVFLRLAASTPAIFNPVINDVRPERRAYGEAAFHPKELSMRYEDIRVLVQLRYTVLLTDVEKALNDP